MSQNKQAAHYKIELRNGFIEMTLYTESSMTLYLYNKQWQVDMEIERLGDFMEIRQA